MVKCVSTIRELRLVLETWRRRDETIGFIPTMGALHEGHLSILRQAQSLSSRVVMSIFVNPLQFAPGEDYDHYPRQLEVDKKLLSDNACDLLFIPDTATMYPEGFATRVDPGPLATTLEGIYRTNHFVGIATIITKLLLQVMPDYAFFGEKNFQQLRVIEQIVQDLHIPVGIIPVPTYRDSDGLPTSGLNILMTPEERKRATLLPEVLETAVQDVRDGHDIEATLTAGREQLEAVGFKVDYFELADARTLLPARNLRKPTRLLIAANIGKSRIIDNMAV